MVGGRYREVLLNPSIQMIAALPGHPLSREEESQSSIPLGQRCDIDCNLTVFRTEHKVPQSQGPPSAPSGLHALMLPSSS